MTTLQQNPVLLVNRRDHYCWEKPDHGFPDYPGSEESKTTAVRDRPKTRRQWRYLNITAILKAPHDKVKLLL